MPNRPEIQSVAITNEWATISVLRAFPVTNGDHLVSNATLASPWDRRSGPVDRRSIRGRHHLVSKPSYLAWLPISCLLDGWLVRMTAAFVINEQKYHGYFRPSPTCYGKWKLSYFAVFWYGFNFQLAHFNRISVRISPFICSSLSFSLCLSVSKDSLRKET